MLNIFNVSTLLAVVNAIIDILCTWVIFYFVLKIVRNNSRTIQIFKGVVIIIIVQAIANLFNLKTLLVLVNMFVNWGPLALIILFSPEIRSMLEKIGQTNILSRIFLIIKPPFFALYYIYSYLKLRSTAKALGKSNDLLWPQYAFGESFHSF